MSEASTLLDTPKRLSLQTQANAIRADLKDFERTFAVNNNGRKPSKDDIKADTDVAIKYKDYGKIRDVLAGRLDYAIFAAPPKSPVHRRRKHEPHNSGISWTPSKRGVHATPRKIERSGQIDVYEAEDSTAYPALLHTIGPTPQRDGKVLGLFDLLSNSAHSSRTGSSSKKRKLDAIVEESPRKSSAMATVQTPSHVRVREEGDILDFLTGTPGKTPYTGNAKYSRTPISEGRKFMLNQFFATPSMARYSDVGESIAKDPTPLRDRLLGVTPDTKGQMQPQGLDLTPAYLKRSQSFKERLLSASRPTTASTTNGFFSPPTRRSGPPTLQHLRAIPKLFHDFEPVTQLEAEYDSGDDLEDDMEALRELENGSSNVLVKDSQTPLASQTMKGDEVGNDEEQPFRVWKKKGQKRTTRRAVMRPANGKLADAPTFVAAENDSDVEDSINGDENQIQDHDINEHQLGLEDVFSDNDYISQLSEDESLTKRTSKKTSRDKKVSATEKPKKTATINPNAVSHMNFRTLKIKNKNSKAKGKGRFGRGRR